MIDNTSLPQAVIDGIIAETIKSLPESLVEFYKKPPGRRPREIHKRISATINSIEDEKSLELVSDVVDATVFSILNLIDSGFKNMSIDLYACSLGGEIELISGGLADLYRNSVSIE